MVDTIPVSVGKEVQVACTNVPFAIKVTVYRQTILVLEDNLQTETLEIALQVGLLPCKRHKGIILVVLQELIRWALDISCIAEANIPTWEGNKVFLLLNKGVGNFTFALELMILETVLAPSAQEQMLVECSCGLSTDTQTESFCPVATKG